jgi:hypothetical protein
MCVTNDFAVVCLDCIDDKAERKHVVKHLKEDGKEIINISENQLNNFAGNMLEVLGTNNEKYLIMSTAAYQSLTQNQIQNIEKYSKIVHSPLDTIEACGGGSARCMMAEVFIQKK